MSEPTFESCFVEETRVHVVPPGNTTRVVITWDSPGRCYVSMEDLKWGHWRHRKGSATVCGTYGEAKRWARKLWNKERTK